MVGTEVLFLHVPRPVPDLHRLRLVLVRQRQPQVAQAHPEVELLAAGRVRASGHLHAVTWENGQIRDLGVPSAEFNESEARDVNAGGRIVGRARTPGHLQSRAFLVENGVMRTLPTHGGNDAEAKAINDAGLVVGGSEVSADGPTRAFLFDSAAGTILNLGTLGDNSSTAFDVNNNGQVVGQAGGAFLWEDGVMLDLNELIDPASGWTLTYASGINELGLIVGQGDNPDGESHAFLLTPIDRSPGPNPIPLPPAAWPGLATLAGMVAYRLRRGRVAL